jgi:hypothetical protein
MKLRELPAAVCFLENSFAIFAFCAFLRSLFSPRHALFPLVRGGRITWLHYIAAVSGRIRDSAHPLRGSEAAERVRTARSC